MKIGIAFDGGGVRGYCAALIAEELEHRLGSLLSDSVDMFAGNSTGSILTGLFAYPTFSETNPDEPKHKTASEVVAAYKNLAGLVFKRHLRYWLSLKGMLTYRYSAKPYEKLLNDFFGNLTLADIDKENQAMMNTYIATLNEPYIFKSRKALKGENEFIKDAVRCSSAAQSYFKPKMIRGEMYVDGLLTANNPTMCLYAEMRRLYPDEELVIINLGTGYNKKQYHKNSLKWCGLLGWAAPFFSMITFGSESTVDYEMKQLSDDVNCTYFRMNPDIPNECEAMDNASDEQLNNLKVCTLEWMMKNDALLNDVALLLFHNIKPTEKK